jgi:hypothetical protein
VTVMRRPAEPCCRPRPGGPGRGPRTPPAGP